MAARPSRQVTPPAGRVVGFGLIGTAGAAALNYAWQYLCVTVGNWPIQVPKWMDTKTLVDASAQQIVSVTVGIGLAAVVGALVLSKSVIAPRIWWLIISTGVGLASVYGSLTLPNTDIMLRLRLTVMHFLVMATLIPAVSKALTISDSDVSRLVRAHTPETLPTESVTAAPPEMDVQPHFGDLNDTLILPEDN